MTIQPIAIDQETAANFVALSVSTMEGLVRKGEFPRPRQVSPRRVAYLVSELTEWMHSRPVSELAPPENSGFGRAGRAKSGPETPAAH